MLKHTIILVALCGTAAAQPAPEPTSQTGGRRLSTLKDDVAVRHRRLLVKQRFEVTPLFESTINADFRHIIGGGLKLEYHFSDMISIGGVGIYSTSIDTG